MGKKKSQFFLVLHKVTNFVVGYTGLDWCTLQPPWCTCSTHYTHSGKEGTPLGTFPCEFTTKKSVCKVVSKTCSIHTRLQTPQTHTPLLSWAYWRGAGAGALVIVLTPRAAAAADLMFCSPEHVEEAGTYQPHSCPSPTCRGGGHFKRPWAHHQPGTSDAHLSNKFLNKLVQKNMLNFTCLGRSSVFSGNFVV